MQMQTILYSILHIIILAGQYQKVTSIFYKKIFFHNFKKIKYSLMENIR